MKIFPIFLVVLLNSLLVNSLTYGNEITKDFVLGGGIRLRSNEDFVTNKEFLHLAIRNINRTVKPSSGHAKRHELIIIPGRKKVRYIFQNKRHLLLLPKNAKHWQSNFKMRKIIYGSLIGSRLNISKLNNLEYLPDWVVAAIDEAVSNSGIIGVSVASRRRFPITRALLANKGKLPDFRIMTELELRLLPVEAQVWYRELARLLVEIMANQNILSSYLTDCAINSNPSPWYKSIVEKIGNSNLQRHLEISATQIIWFNLAPAPAQLLLKELPKLETVEIMELDSAGKPTGKTLTVKLDDLPSLLSLRPDGDTIRNKLVRKLINLTKYHDLATRRVASNAISSIRKLGIDSDALLKLRSFQKELLNHLENRILVERQLRNLEVTLLPIGKYYRLRLNAWKTSQMALSNSEILDLKQAENAYRIE